MAGSQPYINFLPRHNYAQLLGLLPGDLDTLNNIIYLISEYEGISILSSNDWYIQINNVLI